MTTTMRLGTPAKVVNASVRLRVLSPGDVYSSEVSFTISCGGAGADKPPPTEN